MNLTSLTESVDSCFKAIQGIRRDLQERLLLCVEEKEKQKLLYLLQRVESLGPMSAGGYFEISKSTLISMLSVRYQSFPPKKLINSFKCSLTYIIILVQFQMTNGDPAYKLFQQQNFTNSTE